jgi:CBS domain containing-hemolysin-like protein
MDSSPWPGPLALVGFAAHAAATAHQFTGGDWGLLVGLIVSLVLAGLASASETALTSVSRIRIRNLSEEGDPRAQLIERLLRDPNAYLSTILIINSVAVIVASTLATLIALDVFASFGEVISTVTLAVIVLVFCEVTPKTAALQAPVQWARALVRPVYGASVALRPIIAALTFITNGIIRVFGGQAVRRGPFVTEDELRMLVDVSQKEGVLEEDEKELIHNVFEFADTTVRSIMIPRIDMITIEADEPVDAAIGLILQGGQSRIPVYSDTIDNIIGVLYAKDLLRVLAADQNPPSVRALVRRAYFVPETKRLDDLLTELRRERVHMAIVTDEFSQVAGLVTIEDLVEEIIGDIQDEYDTEETLFERIGPNEYVVAAKMSIDDFNDLLDADLPSADYDTLAGFIYTQLDKIPTAGDTVRFDKLTFTVLGTRGRRIVKVRVVREQPALPAPGDEGAAQLNGRDHGVSQVHEQTPAPLPEGTPPLALPPAGGTRDGGDAGAPGMPAGTDRAEPLARDAGVGGPPPARASLPPDPFAMTDGADGVDASERSGAQPEEPRPARHRQPVSRHGHGRGGSGSRRR